MSDFELPPNEVANKIAVVTGAASAIQRAKEKVFCRHERRRLSAGATVRTVTKRMQTLLRSLSGPTFGHRNSRHVQIAQKS